MILMESRSDLTKCSVKYLVEYLHLEKEMWKELHWVQYLAGYLHSGPLIAKEAYSAE